MPISISCPACAAKIKAPENAIGRKAKCPACQKLIVIEAPPGGPKPVQPAGSRPVSAPRRPPAPAERGRPTSSSAETVSLSRPAPRDSVPLSRPALPPPPSKARGLLHIIPAGLLALVACGFVGKDLLSDAKRKLDVAVTEDATEVKKNPSETNSYKVAIEDDEEPKQQQQPVRFTIEDEPEEKDPKVKQQQPKVQIQDEPEERDSKAVPVKVEIKDEPAEEAQGGQAIPIDPVPRIAAAYGPNLTFGISTTGAAGAAGNKLLTYAPDGQTNSTLVRIDGNLAVLGGREGTWTERQVPLPAVPGQERIGSQSTWTVAGKGKASFHVTQILEIVPSKQPVLVDGKPKRVLDTLLVRFVLHNKDAVAHNAGLRIQIDTLIGRNDGVPFTVPGLPGLVDSSADFLAAKGPIPDFIQALERPDLQNPGTVAHLSLKVGPGIAAPDRVSLTNWPGEELIDIMSNLGMNKVKGKGKNIGMARLKWEVPVVPMNGDSAVVLYWNEKPLGPGEKRELGFAYGLGSVTSEGGGKLGVTLGGSFEPGQEFTVTAYVQNPVAGQTLSLELPAGLERVAGNEKEPVPAPGKDGTSIVTWKARVLRTGEFPIRVRSSTGVTQTKTVSIAQSAPTGGKLAVELAGNIVPGGVFSVEGKVTDPVAGQKLTLSLPPGLECVAGELQQDVPALPEDVKERTTAVAWKVKVLQAGKFALRVQSSTGVTQTKTITIAPPEKMAGVFALDLKGSFVPGEVFSVQANVTDPAPGQQLTLNIPAGLECVSGGLQQPVPAGDKGSVSWNVKVREPGRFAIRVQSSTGVTQTKTITIAPPENAAGSFSFTLSGEFAPGKSFTVKAQVANPVSGQTLTLLLPEELKCAGPERKQVPAPGGEKSVLSWDVTVVKPGRHALRVQSSTGVTQKKTINIQPPDETSGTFNFSLDGTIQPGQEFRVTAVVTNPAAGQKLKLVLPEGMERVKGATSQTVPALAAGEKEGTSKVSWTVRVASPLPAAEGNRGRFPIRVESSTGMARTKTVTISGSQSAPAIFGQSR